jgi:hypothetical protein
MGCGKTEPTATAHGNTVLSERSYITLRETLLTTDAVREYKRQQTSVIRG